MDRILLRELSTRDPRRASLAIARQWSILILVIALQATSGSWWTWPVAIVVIASRQHALAVLMHDAAHHLLFRRKWLNDVVGELLLAFPLMVSTQLYRKHHLQHHRHLNTAEDPDLDPETAGWSRRRWLLAALGDLTGFGLLKTLSSADQFSALSLWHRGAIGIWPGTAAVFLVYYGALAAALTLWQLWKPYMLLWLVPMLTVLTFALRLRAAAEHGGCTGPDGTRTVVLGPLGSPLFAPCHIGFHAEHHRYPSVPHFNLRSLHSALSRASISSAADVCDGYLLGRRTVLASLVSRAEQPEQARERA